MYIVKFPLCRSICFLFSFSFVRSIICVPVSHFSIRNSHTHSAISLIFWCQHFIRNWSRTFFIFHIMSHLIWIKTHIFCSCAILSCALVVSYNLYVCTMAVDVANRAHGFFRFYRHPPPKTNIRHSIFNIAHYTYNAHYILCILLSRLVSRVSCRSFCLISWLPIFMPLFSLLLSFFCEYIWFMIMLFIKISELIEIWIKYWCSNTCIHPTSSVSEWVNEQKCGKNNAFGMIATEHTMFEPLSRINNW